MNNRGHGSNFTKQLKIFIYNYEFIGKLKM